ncbi:ribosomal protein L7/L12 [Nonomuraea montanisoli]|uniref:ribosomal protein L7/L12 n=1 Tax=Nonomuraea montanisoli TaxID=2741721 RepID=UPI00196352F7|nr:ribosomal protein L7/L12 [Nonomuraea montanisoli]
MNLGAPEILILLSFVVLFAAAIAAVAITRATRGGTPSRLPRPASPQELDARVRHLAATGQPIHAIKLLRQHTGMGLKEAKDAVDGLAHGRPIRHPALQPHPTPPSVAAVQPAGHTADLAARVRALKRDGRTEQAVFLVRGETGMDHDEATAFVDSVRDGTATTPAGDR